MKPQILIGAGKGRLLPVLDRFLAELGQDASSRGRKLVYDVETPAYSVYYGLGALWRNILPKWDLGIELRHAQNVARDHVLASDPAGARPETFYKIETGLLYLSRRF